MLSIQGTGSMIQKQISAIKSGEVMPSSTGEVKGPSGPEAPVPPSAEQSGWEKAGNIARNLHNGPSREEMEKRGIGNTEEKKMSDETFDRIKGTMNTLCDELLKFYKENEALLNDKNVPPLTMAMIKGDRPAKMQMLYVCAEITKREGRQLPQELQKKVDETMKLVNVIGFPPVTFP